MQKRQIRWIGLPRTPITEKLIEAAERAPIAEQLAFRSTRPPAEPSDTVVWLNMAQFTALVRANFHMGTMVTQPFTVGTDPVRLRPREERTYLFCQNQHAANTLVLGIGKQPGPATGTPVDGLVIGPNRGFYEPLMVPSDELWIRASAASTPGLLIYSVIEGIQLV